MPAALTPQTIAAKGRKFALNERAAAKKRLRGRYRPLAHLLPAAADAGSTTITFANRG